MRQVRATRYVTPLREGGSLPGIVEADDLGTYVCKFRGAGQGLPVLVAEVIVSELAQRLDLRTPQLVAAGAGAGDRALRGRRGGPGPAQRQPRASTSASTSCRAPSASTRPSRWRRTSPARTLWLDALVANVDRSWRNPNLLVWHGDLWLIDHGASLYFHHAWSGGITDPARFAAQPYDIGDHVLAAHAPGRPPWMPS